MKELKTKDFEVKDGRVIAKFLVKTGLKKTLFDIMFPKANPNLPKNWMELRTHLQTEHKMSDEDFKAFQKSEPVFEKALSKYATDFPSSGLEMGATIVDTVIELFADDAKYEALVELAAHMFQVDKAIIEALSIEEVIDAITKLLRDSGFLALLQPSTTVTPNTDEASAA